MEVSVNLFSRASNKAFHAPLPLMKMLILTTIEFFLDRTRVKGKV